MESKLNFEAIEAYAKGYSSKLGNELFANKEKISGEDILKLPIEQTGLFVLDSIYQTWRTEAEKLKSPFFNYEAEAIRQSIQKLMNVLSKNISVKRESFEPLLINAVKNTVLIVFFPVTFYKNLLHDENRNALSLTSLLKFIRINKHVLVKIIEKINDSNALLDNPDKLLKDIFDSLEALPQKHDEYLHEFNKIMPLNIHDFVIEDSGEKEIIEEATKYEFIAKIENEEEEAEPEDILNDRFMGTAQETIADKLKQNQGANSLKSMLTINQKFMFINDLFDGNQEDFLKVIDFLETCGSHEAATLFIENNYLKHNKWKVNAPQVKEFMALLEKKFIS